jgi:hypothetical protein
LININQANKKPFRVLPLVNFHLGNEQTKAEKEKIKEQHKLDKKREDAIKERVKEARKKTEGGGEKNP